MVLAQSKVTAQGQISVPAEVRRRLGLGPGSVIEWEINGKEDELIVRRGVRYTSEDLHSAVFPEKPEPKTLSDLKDGIRQHMIERYGKR